MCCDVRGLFSSTTEPIPALESPRCTNTHNVNAWHEAHSSAGFGDGRLGWVVGEGFTSPKTRGTQNWTRVEDVKGWPRYAGLGLTPSSLVVGLSTDSRSENSWWNVPRRGGEHPRATQGTARGEHSPAPGLPLPLAGSRRVGQPPPPPPLLPSPPPSEQPRGGVRTGWGEGGGWAGSFAALWLSASAAASKTAAGARAPNASARPSPRGVGAVETRQTQTPNDRAAGDCAARTHQGTAALSMLAHCSESSQ